MSNIVLTFAMLFGATICLICAIYVYIINKRQIKRQTETVSE